MTNRPDVTFSGPPPSTILERDTLSHTRAADAIAELHGLGCERIVVDLPDAVSTVISDAVLPLVDLAFVAPGTGHALSTKARLEIGGALGCVVAYSTERRLGEHVHVHSGRGFITFGEEYANGPFPFDARDAKHVLVTHGGADPWHLTERTMRALECCWGIYTVSIVVGPEFNGDTRVLDEMARASRHDVRMVWGAPSLSPLMRSASLAIINGGMTRFELCRTGTPFVAIAANAKQHKTNLELATLGAGLAVGIAHDLSHDAVARCVDTLMHDPIKRRRMSKTMASLFDDRGASRLEQALRNPGRPVQP